MLDDNENEIEDEPDQLFDSIWNTKKEADDRAEYLFFWKNPWGMPPSVVSDGKETEEEPESTITNGMNSWGLLVNEEMAPVGR